METKDLNAKRAKRLLWDPGGQKKMFGRRVSQIPVDLALWEKFLNLHADIKSLIDIGTQDGGMSLFLALQAFQRGMEFRTFDIVHSDALEECFETPLAQLVGLRDKFIHGNIFTDSRAALTRMLAADGLPRPLLLFCDGPRGTHGHASEIDEFVPMLCPGDYWAVHDWGTPEDKWAITPEAVAWMGDSICPLHWDVWGDLCSITRFWRVETKIPARGTA
jgi:cephalosporin hydroxylase